MTVQELINILQNFPADSNVYVKGPIYWDVVKLVNQSYLVNVNDVSDKKDYWLPTNEQTDYSGIILE